MRNIFFTCCICLLTILLYVSCKKDSIYSTVQNQVILSGTRLSSSLIELKKDTIYLLTQSISLENGSVLNIEAGTLIKINSDLNITVNPGAKIEAKGTAQDPIIFTASTPKGTGGAISQIPITPNTNWAGIIINGNKGISSGILSYVRIEFTSKIGGLHLLNVDSTTVINNVQVSYAKPSSFIFSGGNVNASNLISYACDKTDYVLEKGFTGKMQYLLAYRLPFFPDINTVYASNEAVYITGAATFPSISNLTVIGPDDQPLRSDAPYFNERSASLLVDGGSRFRIRNSVIAGYPLNGFYLNNASSGLSLQNGPSEFTYSFVHCTDSARAFYIPSSLIPAVPPINAAAFKNFMLQSRFYNQLVLDTDYFEYTDPYNYNVNPNPIPVAGSPLLSGANFDGTIFSDPFFKKINFRGAIGTENWFLDWTNFIPLQTDYN